MCRLHHSFRVIQSVHRKYWKILQPLYGIAIKSSYDYLSLLFYVNQLASIKLCSIKNWCYKILYKKESIWCSTATIEVEECTLISLMNIILVGNKVVLP